MIEHITEADVRAWMLKRLRELETEYGVRVSSVDLVAHRSLNRGDLPADDYFGVAIHASGACAMDSSNGTIAGVMHKLVEDLRGEPRIKAVTKRAEAERLLKQAEELERLANSTP